LNRIQYIIFLKVLGNRYVKTDMHRRWWSKKKHYSRVTGATHKACTGKIREIAKRKYGNLAVNKSIGFSVGCSILQERLNTKDLQRKRFFLADKTALEIRLHLLFHCPFAQACWPYLLRLPILILIAWSSSRNRFSNISSWRSLYWLPGPFGPFGNQE
jgi:hypothetical protein